jgi:hypothetical protein
MELSNGFYVIRAGTLQTAARTDKNGVYNGFNDSD